MSKPARSAKAADFLSKMNFQDDADEPVAVQPVMAPAVRAVAPKPVQTEAKPKAVRAVAPAAPKAAKAPPSRAALKHIGAYLEQSDVEKVALLRARLSLDNSQLIALAINNLYKAESTKRKFGDA